MEWLNHPASPLQWYNCVFAAMIFLSGLYFTVSILGASADEGGDAYGDAADSGEAEAEAGEADHGNDAGGDGDAETEGSGHSFTPSLTDALNTEGRCPLSLALSLLMMIWGVSGYVYNVFFRQSVSDVAGEGLAFVLGLTVAATVALFSVRRISPVMARHMPRGKVSDTEADLVGRRATPSTLMAPGEPAFVEIENPGGEIKKRALLKLYEGPPLRRGAELVVFGYEEGMYYVAPVNRDASHERGRP
jgi:hypothetical protein